MATTWTNTLSVPRINLRNNINTDNTSSPLKLNEAKFRHIYEFPGDSISGSPTTGPLEPTDDDYGKKLPWLSFHKTSNDLLQVRLSTTVAYVQDLSGGFYTTSTAPYQAFSISGFPLLLQGSSSQFHPSLGATTNGDWEHDWEFYKTNVRDFSGNLETSFGSDDWLNTDTVNSPLVITDMKNKKNLLILDLSSNSAIYSNDESAPNFVLKNTNGSRVHSFGSSTMEKVNRKDRPPYLVIRLDSAIEETTYSSHVNNTDTERKRGLISTNSNFWQSQDVTGSGTVSTKPKLRVFNYVYYGYVISPYDFMANFTTDFLRGALAPTSFGGTPDSFFLHTNNQDNIQVNSEFFSPTHELKTGWSNRGGNHFFINTPYYYDVHLCPQLLNYAEPGDSNIITDTTPWSIRNNVITDISFVNLGSCPDIPTATAPYYIEQLFWFSLHSFRHTEYSAPNLNPSITKKLYLGNYLNVNEVETSTSIDSSGNYMYTNTNADYMPKKTSTGFSPCGCIVTDYHKYDTVSGATRYNYEQGTRSLAMPRKTVTPYFKIDNTNLTEYSKYAFNWKDPTKTWDVSGASGITSNTTYIDVSNCEVIEWRNLVEFDSNTIFHLDIDISKDSTSTSIDAKRYITLVTSDNPKTDYWKNNVQLGNNDVITMDTDTSGAPDPRNIKNIDSEKFRITWGDTSSTIIEANTSKYAYVIDIANGKQVIKATDMGWTMKKVDTSISLDGFLPPSNSDFNFNINTVEYTLGGNPGGTEDSTGVEYLWRTLGAGGGWSVNVLKIGADASNDWGTTISDIEYSPLLDRINFPLDSEQNAITMNINREKSEETQPFGYLNFIGLTSSEFLGGINARDLNSNSNIILSKMFKRRNIETNSLRRAITINPYFKNDTESSDSYWKDNSVKKIFYNPNLFYGHTNFKHSNIYGAAISTFSDSQTDIFFKNGVQNPPTWRSGSHKNDGKEITTLPQLGYIRPSGIDLYISSLTGKFDLNNRVFDGPINEDDEAPTVELNDKITLSEASVGIVDQKFECLNFYKIMHTMSQKNLFISDHWEWKEFLTELIEPPSVYTGPVPITIVMPDKTINKRYNVYNYKATNVPSSVYTTGIHTPDRAYENQCLVSMIIEVSTVSLNVSHILLNTWVGNKTETNEFPMVGLSSFPNENGEYESIYGTPILKINGGKSITPSISTNPVYFSISPTGHFNFATDSTPGTISVNDKSKAPREITEIEGGSAIDFNLSSFGNLVDHHNVVSGGWFTHQPSSSYPSSSNNGIFSNTIPVSTTITSTGVSTNFIPVYNTIDISTNALAQAPTNITTTFNGKFTQESQKFPLELFFTYPFTMDSSIPKPNKIETIYNNSDEESVTTSFNDYKGYKRFSSLYALEIIGSPYSYNNENFFKKGAGSIPAIGRKIFPNTVILNCVELPPPLQVNNFNDMLAGDNSFTRIVWKGYNFDYSPDGPRGQNGNTGNIVWKIERFQTQLEIRKVVFEGTIIPDGGENDNGYNLSKYTFIDKDVRIYDKYRYTVSGIYRYQFKRTRTDPKLYTLELDIGSFTTDEFIICKNNKFEYGRYNTGATNLKLFRPLLINKKGGQVDAFNRPSAGGLCTGNIFSGSTRISSSQNIYANTSNQVTKKGTYVLLSKQQYRPFR